MDVCTYRYSAPTTFRGINWSDPKEVAVLEELAANLEKKALGFRQDFNAYACDKLKMPDEFMVSSQLTIS